MGEIVKSKGNLAQLSVRGNYRAAAGQEMSKIYTRNITQRQLFFSKYARELWGGNENAEFPPVGLPDFKELSRQGDSSAISLDAHGEKPHGAGSRNSKIRKQSDVLKRGGEALLESSVQSLRGTGCQVEPDLAISQELILPEPEKEKGGE